MIATSRRMNLARASCARRSGRHDEEVVILRDLVAEDSADDSALVAADRLATLIDLETTDTQNLIDLGMAYYHHRDFDLSVDLLVRALARPDEARAAPSHPGAKRGPAPRNLGLRASICPRPKPFLARPLPRSRKDL